MLDLREGEICGGGHTAVIVFARIRRANVGVPLKTEPMAEAATGRALGQWLIPAWGGLQCIPEVGDVVRTWSHGIGLIITDPTEIPQIFTEFSKGDITCTNTMSHTQTGIDLLHHTQTCSTSEEKWRISVEKLGVDRTPSFQVRTTTTGREVQFQGGRNLRPHWTYGKTRPIRGIEQDSGWNWFGSSSYIGTGDLSGVTPPTNIVVLSRTTSRISRRYS